MSDIEKIKEDAAADLEKIKPADAEDFEGHKARPMGIESNVEPDFEGHRAKPS